MSHAMQGHPRQMGHGGEFWQNVVHGRREWQTTSVLCLENPMNSTKRQKDGTLKDELPRMVGAQYATGSSVHGIFQVRVLEWGAIAFSVSSCWVSLNILCIYLAALSLSYHTACRIFLASCRIFLCSTQAQLFSGMGGSEFPDQKLNLGLLHCKADS